MELPEEALLAIEKLRAGGEPLNEIDTNELLDRIDQWKNVDLRTISSGELTTKLLSIISSHMASTSTLDRQKLYRVRPLKEGEIFEIESDVWYPNQKYVSKIGRVNDVGDPMLYCALDQNTPVYECGIAEGDWFGLIQYSLKNSAAINLSNVVAQSNYPGVTEKWLINFKIINQFIRTEFTKPVGVGTEYLYRASLKFCRDLFDLPGCDGFLYPSIASFTEGYNVAIKPESADKKIKFDCVLICRLEKFDNNKNGYVFFLKKKANKIENGKLVYQF